MKTTIPAALKVEPDDFEAFRVLCLKRQVKYGEEIGNLISAEVKKNIKLIKGSQA
jgi:hypothetical protein